VAPRPWAERFPLHAAACRADAVELRALLGAGISASAAPADASAADAPAAADAAAASVSAPPPLSLDALDEEGRAALHYAAWNGLAAPVAALLAAGARADVRSGDRAATPAHFAAGMAHPAALRLLLRGGADARALDADRWTPLDVARRDAAGLGRCARADEVEELLREALSAAPPPAAAAAPGEAPR